jgi:hypothetical protein
MRVLNAGTKDLWVWIQGSRRVLDTGTKRIWTWIQKPRDEGPGYRNHEMRVLETGMGLDIVA